MSTVKVIVAGGRDFTDQSRLTLTLDLVLELIREDSDTMTVVSGNARGVDKMGEAWAHHKGVTVEVYRAEWGRLGRGAGFARNTKMAEVADRLVAFWDGKSKGTGHMIAEARYRQLPLEVHAYEP